MAKTIGLVGNDIALDSKGNWMIKEGQAQKAQDASTSIKVWEGECVFDTERGVPYDLILGKQPNYPLIQEYVNQEGKRIEGVLNCKAEFDGLNNRNLDFNIQVTTDEGTTNGI